MEHNVKLKDIPTDFVWDMMNKLHYNIYDRQKCSTRDRLLYQVIYEELLFRGEDMYEDVWIDGDNIV